MILSNATFVLGSLYNISTNTIAVQQMNYALNLDFESSGSISCFLAVTATWDVKVPLGAVHKSRGSGNSQLPRGLSYIQKKNCLDRGLCPTLPT